MTTTTVRVQHGVRAATSGAALVTRRRGVADAGLLALTAIILAATVALALLIPRVVARAADEAVQGAVVDAGTAAEVVARVGTASGAGFGNRISTRDPNQSTQLRADAARVQAALPGPLRALTDVGTVSVTTPIVRGRVGGAAVTTRLAYVGDPDVSRQSGLVTWVDGVAPAPAVLPETDPEDPTPPTHELQVGMQADAASRLGVEAGDHAKLSLTTFGPVDVVVTGLYTVADPTNPVWTGFTDLLAAREAPRGAAQEGHAALLVTAESLPDLKLVVAARALTQQFRYAVDPALVDAATSGTVSDAVTQVRADPTALSHAAGGSVMVSTSLGDVLDAVGGRLAAARAQQSVLVLGLSGVGALVLVLASQLLVSRRAPFLLAERARGASLASVVVRALLESVPLALLAGAAGVLVAGIVLPRGGSSWSAAVALVAVAGLAPAAVAALQVRTAYAGRRTPANRADRERLASRRRVRRIVAEATVVAIAAGAVVSVRRRGLAQTTTGDVDLLLAATPLLVAAAATLVVVRLLPPLLRATSARARRGRGLVAVVATARASAASGTALPLLTLTVAVGLVVFCGTTVLTVDAGQRVAADARVGADVRIEGDLRTQDVDELRGRPGVTAVAGIAVLGARSLGTNSGTTADVVLVDADALADVERAHGRTGDDLTLLTSGDPAHPPTLVSASIEHVTSLVTPELLTNGGALTLDVVGTAGDVPRVQSDGSGAPVDGRVLVDRATFDAAQGAPTDPTTILVDGPGAIAAAAALEDRAGVTVTSRDDWLDQWRDSPLNRDLVLLLLGTSVALAAYAALALVLMVAATSRERGRALSALRTLGLDPRTASALTFAELLPVAVAAVVGGTVIGLLIPWLTSGALGLELATGGFGPPALRVGWGPIVGAVAVVAVALVVTVLVESAVRRRDKLGEVLRVGER